MTSATGQRPEQRYGPLRRNRDFRLLWIGQALSDFGSAMTFLVLPLVLLAAGHSTSVAGTIGAVVLVTGMVVRVPAGYLADRFDQRLLMLGCDLIRLVLVGAIAVAAFTTGPPLALVLVCVVVSQIARDVFRPAQSKVVRRVVPTPQLATAVSLNQARAYSADIIAPAAAGLLFALHPGTPFAVDAATFAASALCVVALTRMSKQDKATDRRPFLSEVTAGCRHVFHDRFLGRSSVYFALLNLTFTALTYTIILGVGSRQDGAVVVGAAMSSAAVAGLAGSLIAPWAKRRLSLRIVLTAGPVAALLLLLLAWTTASTIALAAAFSALCLLTPVTGAVVVTIITETVPDEILGRVTTATSFVAELLQPLGPLAAGLLLAYFSAAETAAALAVMFGLLAAIAVTLPAPSTEEPSHH